MILFPAIDLKQGQCVRLRQGDMTKATIFNEDPAAQAQAFARQGFEYLHVVDLDGAFVGRPMNAAAVEAILAAVEIPLQLGGGSCRLRTAPVRSRAGPIGSASSRSPIEVAFTTMSLCVTSSAASETRASAWPTSTRMLMTSRQVDWRMAATR